MLRLQVAITRDDKFLVSSTADNYMKLWDFQKRRKICKVWVGQIYISLIRNIAFSYSSRYLACVINDYTIRILDLKAFYARA